MDHVGGSHRVPEEVQHIKLETLIPPYHTAMDGDTAGVYGLADVASLRDIE